MTTLSTHDTKRGEDVRARLAVLAEVPGPAGPRVLRRGWPRAPLPDPAFAHLLWQTVVGAWPIVAGAAARVRREGGPGGGGVDELGRPDDGLRDARCTRWSTGSTTTRRCTPRSPTFAARDHPGRLVQLARAEAGAARHARRAGRLPGHRAVGELAGRPGQPAAGRLRRARASCWPGSTRGWRPPVDATGAAKLLVVSRTLRLRRDRPDLFTGYRPVPARRPGRRARGRLRPGRRDRGGHPAAGRAVAARRLGRHHVCHLPLR